MTFSDWLSALGQVVTNFTTWISNCFNSLKGNYIILTILGLGLFYFLFSLVFEIISKLRTRKNIDLDTYKNRR